MVKRGSLGVVIVRCVIPAVLLLGMQGTATAQGFPADISDSELAESLLREFDRVAPDIGNRGSTKITKLTIDRQSGDVAGTVKFTASHSWGKFPAPTFTNPGRKVEVAKSVSASVDFSYNLQSSDVDMETSIPLKISFSVLNRTFSKDFGTITIDLDRVKNIIDGDLNALLELIPNPIPEFIRRERRNAHAATRSDYASSVGEDNLFMSSESFSNFADPQELAVEAITAVVTDGKSLEGYMKRVKSKLEEERQGFVDWLEAKGQNQAEAVFDSLLQGQFDVAIPELLFRFQPIRYESRFRFFGRTTPWVSVNHLAFVVIWKDPNNNDILLDIEPSGTGGTFSQGFVERASASQWQSQFRSQNGAPVNTIAKLDGESGTFFNEQSEFKNVKYEIKDDTLEISGDWQGNQSGKFVFVIRMEEPTRFQGKWRFNNQSSFPAGQTWNGQRVD